MKKLQMKVDDGKWKYVFCYDQWNQVITTDNPKKGLKAEDLEFFQKRFSNHQFKVQILNFGY